ncbi:hypothetical protein [Streptomyces sp. NPDC000410]|uniref:hypothetical protein n=1 Tax=Streptomyces sp. NPDC000410 TaxID=3154254 RepID=UPI00331AD8AD
MQLARARVSRPLVIATAVTGLLAGGIAAGATDAFKTDRPTETIANAAAAQPQSQPQLQSQSQPQSQKQSKFYGTFQKRDGCPYLVTKGGTAYYLPGYQIGGNGALYKKGGGFIAYPGWRIQANGTKQYKPGGTTLCTTWGDDLRIKAKSIYAR